MPTTLPTLLQGRRQDPRWTGTLPRRTPISGSLRLSPWSNVIRLPSRWTLLPTSVNNLISPSQIFSFQVPILCNFRRQTHRCGFPTIPPPAKSLSTRILGPRSFPLQTFHCSILAQAVLITSKHSPQPRSPAPGHRSATPKLQFPTTNSQTLPRLRPSLRCPMDPLSATSAGKGTPIDTNSSKNPTLNLRCPQ